MMRQTIFQRYGGFAKMNRIVSAFYDKVIDNTVTSPYFLRTDMRRLIDHQTRFIASITGGPASYTNDHLERVHQHLAITEDAFLEIVGLLTETLEDFGFEEADVQTVRDELMSRKHFIVTRS